ncbi:MAG: HAMP domain-containing sensor histidine kinase [Planctomycetota bacterium]|nr:HAMP domain-containing sensor histidine kinase [Planctomycetota bacterium]MDA1180135.1 HAMP domain-containing sensor histidine kinase [Planctomycetota bacterium]
MAERSPPSRLYSHANSFLESQRPYYAAAVVGIGISAFAGSLYLPWERERLYLPLCLAIALGYVLLFRYLPTHRVYGHLANYVLQLGWLGLSAVVAGSVPPDDANRGLLLSAICSSFFFYSLPWCVLAQATFMAAWIRFSDPSTLTPFNSTFHLLVAPTTAMLLTIARRTNHDRQMQIQVMEADLKQQASILAHSLRLSTIGQCMAAVTHEIRQPLTALTSLSARLMQMIDQQPPVVLTDLRPHLSDIHDQSLRIATLLRRVRGFSGRESQQRKLESINEVIEESVSLVNFLAARPHIPIATTLLNPTQMTEIDRVQIQQVVVNLLMNAIDCLHETKVQSPYIHVALTRTPESVEIRVEDNGPGIPADSGDIFAPFVTTKKEGMGLGLTISQEIVESHGAQLNHLRLPNGHTCFSFSIPYSESTTVDSSASDAIREPSKPPSNGPHWKNRSANLKVDSLPSELQPEADQSSPPE